MITTNTMYELHMVEHKMRLEEIEKEIAEIKPLRDKLIKYFYDSLKHIPFELDLETIKSGKQDFLTPALDNSTKYFNIQLKYYNKINIQYTIKVEQRDKLKQYKLKRRVFHFIIYRFNELLRDALIYECYKFKDMWVGGFEVIFGVHKKPMINWGTSLKKKAELIANGEIPYLTKDALAIGDSYKGVKWMQYLQDYNLFFQWNLDNIQFIRLPNIKQFTFKPYDGIKSSVQSINDYRKQHTREELEQKFKPQINAT